MLTPETLQQLVNWRPPFTREIIRSGLLPDRSRMLIYGAENTWKTMLAIHTAFICSLGRDWFFAASDRARTILIQLELSKQMFRERVIKISQNYPELENNMLWFATEYDFKLDNNLYAQHFTRVLQAIQPRLVIIDPLFKILTGRISDQWDMQRLLDNIDRWRMEQNCSFVLIHHSRKPVIADGQVMDLGSSEAIGSSYIKMWVDTIIRVSRLSDTEIRLTPEKVRNAPALIQPMLISISRETLAISPAR